MILCSGCFDGLHWGHVSYLYEARKHLDPQEHVLVAVAPDDYIRRVKGRDPQWTLGERMGVMMIHTLRSRDEVTAHASDGAADVIRRYKPRLFVKGSDWKGRIPADVQDACNAVGCRIEFVDSGVRQHTSDAIPA